MTTRYFTNKGGYIGPIGFDIALNYVSMEDGIWVGHRIDGSSIDLPLLTLMQVCQNIIEGTWVELTEPPKIGAPATKALRQTIVEAAINLKQAYQDIKVCLEGGQIPYFNDPGFNAAEDAWCRIEYLTEQEFNEENPWTQWRGDYDQPCGTVSGNIVKVEYRGGEFQIGFVHEFDWLKHGKPSDILQYRVLL